MSVEAGTDARVEEAIAAIADRLTNHTVPTLGSLLAVRERDLEADTKTCLNNLTGKVAVSRVLRAPGWPSLGHSAVDVVVPERDDPLRPRHLLELKWCQERQDKVYEAIWDLFKLACLSRLETVESAHLVTGAPLTLWETAFCGDIFDGGLFSPGALCSRVLPRGRDPWLAWDDLLYGGDDRAPDSTPGPIETRPVARSRVRDGELTWEIRAVSVHSGAEEVPFAGGWPHGQRPDRARRPAAAAPDAEAPSESADDSHEGSGNPQPISLGPRFDEAVALARTLHFGHVRKGTPIPYLAHLLAVSALVLEDGGDEDEAIAALLHDAVEDQGGAPRLEQIRQLFGDRVAAIVDACTDTDVEPKPPWRERKEQYIAHLRSTDRPDALRVSLADKLHNARAILFDLREHGEELWSRFTANSADEQLWYYNELAQVFEERYPGRSAAELRSTVDEIRRLARSAEA